MQVEEKVKHEGGSGLVEIITKFTDQTIRACEQTQLDVEKCKDGCRECRAAMQKQFIIMEGEIKEETGKLKSAVALVRQRLFILIAILSAMGGIVVTVAVAYWKK